MLGKDRKVFVLGVVVSSFALMTTLKAQNYSYESNFKPYVRSGAEVFEKAKVEVMPLSGSYKKSNSFDLDNISSDDVVVSYSNDRYPVNKVHSKRKVMRIGSSANSFRDSSSSGDWVVKIGEEEVNFVGGVNDKHENLGDLTQARNLQYGNLQMDEIAVGQDLASVKTITTNNDMYTLTDNKVVDEVELFNDNQSQYQEVEKITKRMKEQKSYPWVRSETARGPVSNNINSQNTYSDAYRNQKVQNPWANAGNNNFSFDTVPLRSVSASVNQYDVEDVSVKKIVSKSPAVSQKTIISQKMNNITMQERQQAYVSSHENYSSVSAVVDDGNYENIEKYSEFDRYAQGTSAERFTEGAQPVVESVKKGSAKKQNRPLLVPIKEDIIVSNNISESSGVTAEYKVDVVSVPASVVAPISNAQKDDGNISLTELKINFKPSKSDLSVKTVRWLKEFSKKAVLNFENIIEIKISPNMPYLQNERLLMLRGVLTANGVYDQQIRVVTTRRAADSVIIKVIEAEDEDSVEQNPMNYAEKEEAYYYYY